MPFINIEIKAKCFHPEKVEAFLVSNHARFTGIDYQKDTYFNVSAGRLKLRQGNIENTLIYYNREDEKGPKKSDCYLVPASNPNDLEKLLTQALGVKTIVNKVRKIYYLDNIKIHIDELDGLGCFVEIEAGNYSSPAKTPEDLNRQCKTLIHDLDIKEEDLLQNSYSDMLPLNDNFQ